MGCISRKSQRCATAVLPNGCGGGDGSAVRTRCRGSSPIPRYSTICAPSPKPTGSQFNRRPGEGRDPLVRARLVEEWIPAYGMTKYVKIGGLWRAAADTIRRSPAASGARRKARTATAAPLSAARRQPARWPAQPRRRYAPRRSRTRRGLRRTRTSPRYPSARSARMPTSFAESIGAPSPDSTRPASITTSSGPTPEPSTWRLQRMHGPRSGMFWGRTGVRCSGPRTA